MSAWHIIVKDLQLLARDRRAIVILLVLPLVVIAIVGSSTGRLSSNPASRRDRLRLAVVDEDHSERSKSLTKFLAAEERVVVEELDRKTADALLESDTVDAAIIIDDQFAKITGELSRTELLNPTKGRLSEGSEGLGLSVKMSEDADLMLKGSVVLILRQCLRSTLLPLVAEKVPILKGAARDTVPGPPWAESEEANSAEPETGGRVYRYVVPAYTVMFVFFLVTIMGRSFIQERELGTLRRLRIAPISPTSILVGKTVPFLIVSVAQTLVLLIAGRFLFDMSWGPDPAMLVPVVLATSLAATTLGLAFSTLVRTDSQVSAYGSLIVLSTAGISGCLVPRQWMPPLTQQISLCTPHAWALDAYSELLTKEAPRLHIVWSCCGVLMLFATVFFVIGQIRFRNDGE